MMRTAIALVSVVVIVGLAAFVLQSQYFGTRKSDGVAVVSPSERRVKDAQAAQTLPVPGTAYDPQRMRTWYESAARISSVTDRDMAYGALVEDATGQGDFELALDIAGRISVTGKRDRSYASIARQALAVGDFAAADKAAEAISSLTLREEQFNKMAGACPSNTKTEGPASVLGLQSGTHAAVSTAINPAR